MRVKSFEELRVMDTHVVVDDPAGASTVTELTTVPVGPKVV